MKSDPNGIYCPVSAGLRRPRMLHEPMPSELAGAPRWLSPDTSRVRASAGVGSDSKRRRIRRPRVPETVRMRLGRAFVRLKDLARLRMAWW
ncbi:hypothetical protein [Mycobacterium sp. E2327]|uniref:hypothetical protein n=1 Tax=Mycobacterium sp. E2327 TaxID=1834132 RepID=UPI000AE2328C|nr:hypothetical protein [Mycobacterium sp. E2327]